MKQLYLILYIYTLLATLGKSCYYLHLLLLYQIALHPCNQDQPYSLVNVHMVKMRKDIQLSPHIFPNEHPAFPWQYPYL